MKAKAGGKGEKGQRVKGKPREAHASSFSLALLPFAFPRLPPSP